ncbi:hypothetical protein BN2475_630035 [Paraburkholderia ribeironis]|uniref:Uncharacterized protein n=1 Tax=Paraburkholderia ribeironis TaxID=1247936 RepID=A0A1N7SFS6_9BURK|nr:hypothetical protein BN2475_630035 [Paraburkholderia ribeironis]
MDHRQYRVRFWEALHEIYRLYTDLATSPWASSSHDTATIVSRGTFASIAN